MSINLAPNFMGSIGLRSRSVDEERLDSLTPIHYVDAHRDMTVLVDYSYDGQALSLDFYRGPTRLDDLPCPDRIWAMIQGRQERPLLPRHAMVFEPTVTELSTRPGCPAALCIVFRIGEIGYTFDVIGDGTQLIHYTVDGLALMLELRSPDLGVVLGSMGVLYSGVGVPFPRELETLLRQRGIPIAGKDIPACQRPVLEGWSWEDDPTDVTATIVLGRGWEADFVAEPDKLSDGESRVSWEVSDEEGSLTLFLRHLNKEIKLDGLPSRPQIEAILRNHGIRVGA